LYVELFDLLIAVFQQTYLLTYLSFQTVTNTILRSRRVSAILRVQMPRLTVAYVYCISCY